MRKMNNRYIVINIVTSILLILFVISSVDKQSLIGIAYAQADSARLSGWIVDEGKLPIAGATIQLTRIDTNKTYITSTDENGKFTFGSLPATRYKLIAERQGFAKSTIDNITLNIGDQISVKAIEMTVGNINDSVTITDISLIKEDVAVGNVVDKLFIDNLPLNGKSFNSLILLTASAVITKANPGNPGQFSINGQRSNDNYYMIDGVSANIGISPSLNLGQSLNGGLPGLSSFGGTSNLVSTDALQEFRVLTSSYAPEYGRMPGGQISMLTRSGGNKFHGLISHYFRNDVLDANDWFANRVGENKLPLRQNNFGASLGGPIILPKKLFGPLRYNGREKTFFFFSYEGLRMRQPQFVFNDEVPSNALRELSHQRIKPYLQAFPIPNGPELIDGIASFSGGYSNPSNLDAYSIRLDHYLTDKINIFGRFNESPSNSSIRFPGSLSSPFNTIQDTRTITIGATLTFNSRITNDFRGNYSTTNGQTVFTLDNFGGAVPVSPEKLFPSFADPKDSLVNFMLMFGNLWPTLYLGSNANNTQRQINFTNVLSINTTAHQLKFGVDYRRLSPSYIPTKYALAAGFEDSQQVIDAIAGNVITLAQQQARPLISNYSFFAQDTWRLNSRLSLTYGLRWDINPAPTTADGNEPYTAIGVETPATMVLAPRGTPLYSTDYTNFAPRFGFTYQLFSRPKYELVLRGGGGVFYDIDSGVALSGFNSIPFSTGYDFRFAKEYPLSLEDMLPPPFPAPPFSNVSYIVAFDPQNKPSRTFHWNFGIEQSLGKDQFVSISYVAAAGRNLPNAEVLLNPNAIFSSISIVRDDAFSDYHSMQVKYNRRFHNGLQILANYTWAHSIDNVSNDIQYGLARGSSDFDVRHSFKGAVSYRLPNIFSTTPIRSLTRNWGLEAVFYNQSATPVDIIARSFINIEGKRSDIRPDFVLGVPLYIYDSSLPGGRKINRSAFTIPISDRQGNLGRNVLRGFPLNQVDVSLKRNIKISERTNLIFKADVFNILNHPNFADPVVNLSSSPEFFGQSTSMLNNGLGSGGASGGFSPLYQIGGSRSIQLSLKFEF